MGSSSQEPLLGGVTQPRVAGASRGGGTDGAAGHCQRTGREAAPPSPGGGVAGGAAGGVGKVASAVSLAHWLASAGTSTPPRRQRSGRRPTHSELPRSVSAVPPCTGPSAGQNHETRGGCA